MTEQNLMQLLSLLDEYYQEQSKTCEYDCYNCDLGILRGYDDDHTCAIEVITEKIENILYHKNKNFRR